MTRPNILYIHSHDTGRYIQPYGHNVPTPNMQKFAEEGVLFTQAFCAGPTCSPSRAALLTGQSPHRCGMLGLAHLGFGLNNYSHHLLHTLRDIGYQSALAGVQHVAEKSEAIGYDNILPLEGNRRAGFVADAAEKFLTDTPQQPFFLSVGFVQTHRVFPEPGPDEDPRRCRPPAHLPNTPETRHDWASYQASARELDEGMGQVLNALAKNGLADNTLVICTTDHGVAFPRMKCSLTDMGTGIMLMMRGPGGFDGGKVIDGMVSHVDVFPTVCELLGIDPPDRLEGKSMMPLIRGEAEEINEEIFSEVSYHAAYEPKRSVRTNRYKYIKRYDRRVKPVLPNCDDGLTKRALLDAGMADQPVPAEQLYDLAFDACEMNNLAAEPSRTEILEDMCDRLDRWMRRTNDPLLSGSVAPPEGAKGMDPDALHPTPEGMKPL